MCIQVKLEAEVRLDLLNSFARSFISDCTYFAAVAVPYFLSTLYFSFSFSFFYFILSIPVASAALPVAAPLNIY